MALYVRQLKLGPMENFVYLVGAEGARETAIVDPAWDVEAAQAAAGADGRSLTHALVSHHHFDHVNGLPQALALGGIRVFAHRADVPKLAPELQREVTPLAAGDAVEVGPLRVVAMHTPGHTPGSCSFVREADRTVIAGDCVLKRVTPNPVISVDPIDPSRRFRSLAEYMVSLARVRSFAPTLVLGGHGEPIHDFEELFNRYLKLIRERQATVIASIPKSGATAWEVSRAIFPGADDVHRFLAVSEAVAHLDYAQSEGKIALEIGEGREVYRRISAD